MHLNRERLAHIEELQEQWEATEVSGELAQHLLRRLPQQLTDSLAFERSIGDQAGMVIAVAQKPRFADGVVARQWCEEQLAKRRPPQSRYW